MKKKNVVVILASGMAKRMHQDIPKQFLTIYDKPLIIYTLEVFQNHPEIDAIIVACLTGWHSTLKAYAKQFNITKLKKIVDGGNSWYESSLAGIKAVSELYNDDTLIMIHAANRPLVSNEIISNSIKVCNVYGNAITSTPCVDVVMETSDGVSAFSVLDRGKIVNTQTPQSFILKDLLSVYKEAQNKGITNFATAGSLYVELGKKVYFSIGSEKNIKITTVEDIEIFKALLSIKQDEWIKS